MGKLRKDTKGAVTVFVTFLLIPAILVSGTAVDLARLHTARSILQDSNQLAANSVLTQYNALLNDLYGLFGVAEDDPILAQLMDDYIRVSVFGEPAQDRTMGTFQLFYGADIDLEEPILSLETSLASEDVLRRQIEEYMKFRAPVVIVKEILEALDNTNLKADKAVVENKTAIDADIMNLYDKYKELYDEIVASDRTIQISGVSGGHFGTVSSTLRLFQEQFANLWMCYQMYLAMPYPDNADYAAQYVAILENINALVVGNPRGSHWVDGTWATYGGNTGLEHHVEKAKQQAIEYKKHYEAVLRLSKEIDEIHSQLKGKIEELERIVASEECSEALRIALTVRQGDPPMSMLERYREVLQFEDVTSLGSVYRDGSCSYIDDVHIPMLDDVRYRDKTTPSYGNLTMEELKNLKNNSSFWLSDAESSSYHWVEYYGTIPEGNVGYNMMPGFKKFSTYSSEHRDFYIALQAMRDQPPMMDPVLLYEDQEVEEGSDAEEEQRKIIDDLLKLVNTAYNGLTNKPLGAMYINDSTVSTPDRLGILEILSLIPQAISDPIIKTIEDPRGSMAEVGNNILLLTYCSTVFSNYTTARPEIIGKTREDLAGFAFPKSITGVPMSPQVNYFFQSEWEYLYHGTQNAGSNLSAVTKLLFLVRLVCNYITVFGVPEVNAIVLDIQVAFAWCPPLALLLGELARGAFAAAETVVDVAALRSGYKVPLIKNVTAGEWICTPKGVLRAVSRIVSSESADKALFQSEKGLTYSQYMLCFFAGKMVINLGGGVADELALRAGNLIEWNMINYENDVNANEEKMSQALENGNGFRLSKMMTGFELRSTVNMRMLFLSMPIAQKGLGSVVPPSTMPISASDFRGY